MYPLQRIASTVRVTVRTAKNRFTNFNHACQDRSGLLDKALEKLEESKEA